MISSVKGLSLRNVKTGGTATVEIMMDGGPLCVAGVWKWEDNSRAPGLFRVYHKRSGLTVGPFYASIPLAERGMRKALSLGVAFWEQPTEWYPRQAWFGEWLDKHLGAYDALIDP
jgi:hypothetical protein